MVRQWITAMVMTTTMFMMRGDAQARHVVTNGWVLSIGGSDTERLASERPGEAQWRHLGVYGAIEAGYLWAISPRFALVPSIGIAFAPDTHAWGGITKLTAEWHISDYVGLDLIASVMHDQPGLHWSHAELFVGLGPGVSIFLAHGKLIVSASVLFMHNVANGSGGVVVPSLLLGWKI